MGRTQRGEVRAGVAWVVSGPHRHSHLRVGPLDPDRRGFTVSENVLSHGVFEPQLGKP